MLHFSLLFFLYKLLITLNLSSLYFSVNDYCWMMKKNILNTWHLSSARRLASFTYLSHIQCSLYKLICHNEMKLCVCHTHTHTRYITQYQTVVLLPQSRIFTLPELGCWKNFTRSYTSFRIKLWHTSFTGLHNYQWWSDLNWLTEHYPLATMKSWTLEKSK